VSYSKVLGLAGTPTFDIVTSETSPEWEGPGGVLYQCAALSALGVRTRLYCAVGKDLREEFKEITRDWDTLSTEKVLFPEKPGNRVRLHYPLKGERRETLLSLSDPLDIREITGEAGKLDFFIMVMNSGFELRIGEWDRLTASLPCPVWLDIHSLALSRETASPRSYRSLSNWKQWARGTRCLQANRKEAASMLGEPGSIPGPGRIRKLGPEAFEVGVEALFITLGEEGVFLMTPGETILLSPDSPAGGAVDTTGAGDAFCAGAASRLVEGDDPVSAGRFGIITASLAVKARGVREIYRAVEPLGRNNR